MLREGDKRGWNDPPYLKFDDHVNQSKLPAPAPTSVTHPLEFVTLHLQNKSNVESDDKSTTPIHSSPIPTESSTKSSDFPSLTPLEVVCRLLSITTAVAAQENVVKRDIDDIRKKCEVLRGMLDENKISDPVIVGLRRLVFALEVGDYDQAHALHLQLMAEYTSEVTRWMVGVKKLIGICRQVQWKNDQIPVTSSEHHKESQ